MKGRVLIIAGSDSSGGAGIQADIKTVTALDGYAMTAITALTAQNTQGVQGVVGVDPDFIKQQMHSCLDDIGVDAIKTGMLHSIPVIEAVAEVIKERCQDIPVVVDPVMVAQSGASLLDPAAVNVMSRDMALVADVLTPNVPEAEKLSGMTVKSPEDMREAADMLMTLGPKAVLLKGGHLESLKKVTDVLASDSGQIVFEDERLKVTETHGTGCTLASALATGLAQGMSLKHSVVRARSFVQEALKAAPGYGKGQGPLNHCHSVGIFTGN
ncbi:bifunctional hydroxymethylpyrimidine kinase/phosphomethylpyrimidine kinase [Rhodovibrionaceae bacterium A322]